MIKIHSALRQPYLLTGLIFGLFLAVVKLVNILLIRQGFITHLPWTFPFSLARFRIDILNITIGLLFFIIVFLSVRFLDRVQSIPLALFIGYLLIVFGNLAQGGIKQAFIYPFTESGIQYYHDAILINNGGNFLRNFNEIQTGLHMHSLTHPPFAVLIHYWILSIADQSVLFLSFTFSLSIILCMIVLTRILVWNNTPREKIIQLIILFAVIPGINIYGIVCLDSIIFFFATLFCAGILCYYAKKPIWLTFTLLVVGFTGVNLLTFMGVYFAGIGGLVALYELLTNKRRLLLTLLIIVGIFFLILLAIFYIGFNYNHIEAFFEVPKFEYQGGFALLTNPLRYFITRFESLLEPLVFFGLPIAGILLNNKFFINKEQRQDPSFLLFSVSIIIFILMLLIGVFRTGETARPLLFLYPLGLIILHKNFVTDYKQLIIITAIQTAVMQSIWSFFW